MSGIYTLTDSNHYHWFVDTGDRETTADGKTVEIWEYQHNDDEAIISEWAGHFRNHYCLDQDIDYMRGDRGRTEYLNEIKFPTKTGTPGPSIRSGDFTEILVADFFQWILGFWVPRVRWSAKIIQNESPKGCDILGFKLTDPASNDPGDEMAVIEAKAKFSAGSSDQRLQTAITDSAKDPVRLDESLNYVKQRLYEREQLEDASKVGRFQNPVDHPYVARYGAAAFYTEGFYSEDEITLADTEHLKKKAEHTHTFPHPKPGNLHLLVFKGNELMTLAHKLYEVAADEA